MASLRREPSTPDNAYVCSRHFSPDDLDDSCPSGVRLREGAVPRLQFARRTGRPIHQAYRAVRERAAAATLDTVPLRTQGAGGGSGVDSTTPNAAPGPAAVVPPSPSKKVFKKRLAKAERRLGNAEVKIRKLTQRKRDLKRDTTALERSIIVREAKATHDEDRINRLERLLKDEYTLPGPPAPSTLWDAMED